MPEHTLKKALQAGGRITLGGGNWAIVHYHNIFIKTSADMFMIDTALSNDDK